MKAVSNSNFVIVTWLLEANWGYRWEFTGGNLQKLRCSVKNIHFATKGDQIFVYIKDNL